MQLATEWIRYGNDNQFSGYMARPEAAIESMPAIVVLQEIWGVDAHIQDVTRRFAQAGYVALAPDLMAVSGKRPDILQFDRVDEVKAFLDSLPPTAWGNNEQREAALAARPAEEAKRIGETLSAIFGGNRPKAHMDHLLSATSFLRNEYSLTKGQHVGSVGFCMGGALSALLACRDPQLKGAVIFYGTAPQNEELLSQIEAEVLGFYGQLDSRISDAVPALAEQMKSAGKTFDYHIYEGAHHAFFNDTRRSYNVNASRDAFARTLAFFSRLL